MGYLIPRVFSADARRFAFFILTYGVAFKGVAVLTQVHAAPFWFPDAVLLCWLLLSPRNEWWFYLLAPLPIRLSIEAPFSVPFWFLVATYANDSLKGLFSAYLLERVLPQPVRLNSLRALRNFLLVAALLVPALSSVVGAVTRSMIGYGFIPSLYEWFASNAITALVMTTALIYWFTDYAEWKRRWKELTLLLAILVPVLAYAFTGNPGIYGPLLLYVPVPFLIWAAVRLGPTATSTALSLIAAVSIVGAALGKGTFASSSHPQSLLPLQLFLAVVSLPLMLLAVVITERTRATEAVEEREKRFRLIADTAPVLIWMSSTNKLYTYFNNPWLDFTGRSIESELGNGWAEGVHPDDLQKCLDTYTGSFDRKENFRMEYRLRRNDGEYRWILDIGVPRFHQGDTFAGYIGIAVDVTERKQAEESRFRHAAIVESSEDAIISKNRDAVITSWNAGAERIFGYAES